MTAEEMIDTIRKTALAAEVVQQRMLVAQVREDGRRALREMLDRFKPKPKEQS